MVKLVYYTDPICSSCWLAEPFLNKLLIEYGDNIDTKNNLVKDMSLMGSSVIQEKTYIKRG